MKKGSNQHWITLMMCLFFLSFYLFSGSFIWVAKLMIENKEEKWKKQSKIETEKMIGNEWMNEWINKRNEWMNAWMKEWRNE